MIVLLRDWTPAGYALGAALLFGTSIPLLKFLTGNISPLYLVACLYLGTAFGMILMRIIVRSQPVLAHEAAIGRHDVAWLLVAILAGGVIAPILLLVSLAITPAATVSLLLNSEAVATTVIAAVVFREFVGRRIWIALGVITLAGILLVWNPSFAPALPAGAAGVVLASVFWGIDNNATRQIAGKNPVMIVVFKSFCAGSVSLVLALASRDTVPPLTIAVSGMIIGFLCYGLSMIFFIRALRDLGAARTGAYFSAAPFIGAVLSLALFRQVPDLQFTVAAILLLSGTFLLITERHTLSHHHLPFERKPLPPSP